MGKAHVRIKINKMFKLLYADDNEVEEILLSFIEVLYW